MAYLIFNKKKRAFLSYNHNCKHVSTYGFIINKKNQYLNTHFDILGHILMVCRKLYIHIDT